MSTERQPLEIMFLQQEEAIEAGLTDMEGCVEKMEYVFELYNQGRVIMGGGTTSGQTIHGHMTTFPDEPEYPEVPESGPDRRFGAMPAYVGGDVHKMGVKWYGSNVNNPAERGIPRSLHTITLNDPDSGEPLFLMDGQVESAMRTGAVSGVGAKYIQGDRAEVATIIGPGVIGQTSALAMDVALDSLKEIQIHHPELRKAEAFKEYMEDDIDTEIVPNDSPEDAISKGDVVSVAAAGSPPPRIKESWLKDDTVVIPLGDLRVPLEAFEEELVFCDIPKNDLEFAEHLDWDITNALGAAVDYNKGLKIDEEDLRAIHDIITGKDSEPTDGKSIFYPLGLPMEDVTWTNEVYQNAKKMGLGQTLTLFEEPYFQKPY